MAMKKRAIGLDDWLDICEKFKKQTNASLSWGVGYIGWDFDDSEGVHISRDFLKLLNEHLSSGDQDGTV